MGARGITFSTPAQPVADATPSVPRDRNLALGFQQMAQLFDFSTRAAFLLVRQNELPGPSCHDKNGDPVWLLGDLEDWADRLPIADAIRISRYIPQKVRAEVYARDGEVCAYCGATSGPFQLDHVHPVSRGGANTAENLTVACAPCNSDKRDKTLDEWKGRA